VEDIIVAKKQVYKVPIFKKDNLFAIWTGNGAIRYFNDHTLPDCIKVPLAIVMNSPKAAELNQKEMTDMDMSKGVLQEDIFKAGSGWDESFKEIGWQYNKHYYVVILTPEELELVQGKEKAA
jgi:hypothetical protein